MSWLLLTLFVINLWAIANLIDKYIISKRVKSPIPLMVLWGFGSLAYSAIAFSQGAVFNPPSILLGFLLGTTILLYVKSLSVEEASRVISYFNVIPLIVAVLAFLFLGESFGPEKYLGIFLVVGGAALISLKKVKGSIISSKALPFMALFILLYSIASIFMKFLVDSSGYLSVFANYQLGVFLFGILILSFKRNALSFLNKKNSVLILGSQAIGVAGFFFLLAAYSLGPVTLISGIENIQGAFVFVYALILSLLFPKIIKEETSRSQLLLKLLAIVLMAVGALIISF